VSEPEFFNSLLEQTMRLAQQYRKEATADFQRQRRSWQRVSWQRDVDKGRFEARMKALDAAIAAMKDAAEEI
jgi:hypothetical protein